MMEDSKDQIEMLFSFTNAGGHGGFNGTKRSVRYLTELSVRMEIKQVEKHVPMDILTIQNCKIERQNYEI